MIRPRTHDAAKGKWKGILLQLGFESKALSGKACPCPLCGGKDRFTFDNQKGEGSAVCRGCGSSGNGWALLEKWKGWDFKTAAAEVDAILGSVKDIDRGKPTVSEADARKWCTDLWAKGVKIEAHDLVSRYLELRDCPLPQNLDCLRFVQLCPVPNASGFRPAMVASVKGPDGKGVTLHRTFLRPDGSKADMENPRAMMPVIGGKLPDGAAVRLSSLHGERLGIGEGIETSLKAGQRFNVPVWAALTSTMLAKFVPPPGVTELHIFGDADAKFGGQAAAYALAHAATTRHGLEPANVHVHIPTTIGTDWADRHAA